MLLDEREAERGEQTDPQVAKKPQDPNQKKQQSNLKIINLLI
jgi:hypothetical protein